MKEIQNSPEETLLKEIQWRKFLVWRFMGMVALWVSSILFMKEYCDNEEFRNSVNDRAYKMWYASLPG